MLGHSFGNDVTKRLTYITFCVVNDKRISTHSLTKRLTASSTGMEPTSSHFNSQPHEEADRLHSFRYSINYISTHSLTKRLTILIYSLEITELYFNSQPHEEADSRKLRKVFAWRKFQLTASRRG